MVHRVVDFVTSEGLDGERCSIGPPPYTPQLLRLEAGKSISECRGGDFDFIGHGAWVLQVVPLGFGGDVWIPIRKEWIVVIEHEFKPSQEQSKYVSHMSAVFERTPDIGTGSIADIGSRAQQFGP